MGRKTKITKVLTGILSGLAFSSFYIFAFAGTDETGGLKTISETPEAMGRSITSELSNLFIIVGIGLALITVMVIGLRLVIVRNSEEVSQTYEWLKYVIIGSIILAVLSTIIGIVVGFEEKFYEIFKLPKTSTPPALKDATDVQDASSDKWYIDLISGILTAIYEALVWVGKFVGFKPIDKLIFNESAFSADQYKFMLSFYWLVTLVATAFIVVMIGKTAIGLIATGYSPRKRADLMDEIYTWFKVIIFIAVYPLLFVYLMKFFDSITGWLFRYVQLEYTYIGDNNFANSDLDGLITQIKTTNKLNTAIVKALYGYMYFKLNMIFLVRRIVLGVFFLFAPVAAALWGIKRDSNVMNVWVGEVVTNASMGFFYGFALLAVLHLINALDMTGWFFTLIAMWMLPQIGGTLRNMLQNWFQRVSGIDEEHAVSPLFTGVFPMVKGSSTSLAYALTGGKIGSKIETGSAKIETGTKTTKTTTEAVKTNNLTGSISGQGSVSSRLHPDIENAENTYRDTNMTRTAFLQSFGALASRGVAGAFYSFGNMLQTTAAATFHDNPLFALTMNRIGSTVKSIAGGSKIGAAINHATLQRMASSSKYAEQMQKINGVASFLAQRGKGDMLTKAIITGDVNELVTYLNNAPVGKDGSERSPIPIDFVETIEQLHKAFKEERKITQQHLGFNGVSGFFSKAVAATKIGKGPENFTAYFYKKHPYAKASDAFIFKV